MQAVMINCEFSLPGLINVTMSLILAVYFVHKHPYLAQISKNYLRYHSLAGAYSQLKDHVTSDNEELSLATMQGLVSTETIAGIHVEILQVSINRHRRGGSREGNRASSPPPPPSPLQL